MAAAPIIVEERAGLNRVAFAYDVLRKNIRDVNVLLSSIETIQAAVRVFLKLREVSHVVLITIVVERSEYTRAQVIIGKNKSAEIRDERLNADAQRNEIKVRIDIGDFLFDEGFL